MAHDGLWTVETVKRSELATGGLVKPGSVVAVFDGGYIIPARLAKIIEPWTAEDD